MIASALSGVGVSFTKAYADALSVLDTTINAMSTGHSLNLSDPGTLTTLINNLAQTEGVSVSSAATTAATIAASNASLDQALAKDGAGATLLTDAANVQIAALGTKTQVVVNLENVTVAENASIPVSSFIKSVSNPNGDNITQYDFWDGGTGNGHFTVGGVAQPDGQGTIVNASNLSSVQYVGGSASGSETLIVWAYDATTGSWTAQSQLTATTVVPVTATTDNGAHEVGIGHVVTITLNTTTAETVTGTPTLQLNDNEVASYVGGSGTTALQFAYTVQPGDSASDLQVTGLNLPGGATIHDASGNAFSTAVTGNLGLQVITLVTNLQSNEDHLVYLLYQASFARVPDYAGFEYWAGQADAQQFSALQLADFFIASPEFTAKFGANPTNAAYVTELYTNVLGRTPDSAGLAYWIAQANAGIPHDQLLVDFATSPENIQTTGPHTAHGYWVT
jgi:hypothetical protein